MIPQSTPEMIPPSEYPPDNYAPREATRRKKCKYATITIEVEEHTGLWRLYLAHYRWRLARNIGDLTAMKAAEGKLEKRARWLDWFYAGNDERSGR